MPAREGRQIPRRNRARLVPNALSQAREGLRQCLFFLGDFFVVTKNMRIFADNNSI